jgi:hypothetical protein
MVIARQLTGLAELEACMPIVFPANASPNVVFVMRHADALSESLYHA